MCEPTYYELARENALLKLDLARTRAHVATLEADERARSKPLPPNGDMDDGYTCAHCGTDITYPEEQRYCDFCGCAIDWRTWVDIPDDELAFDRRFDR